MSLYCFPIRISVAGSDIGLFLTRLRMIEEGFRSFVIAIERRHGIGDRLSAVVVEQKQPPVQPEKKAVQKPPSIEVYTVTHSSTGYGTSNDAE